MKEEKVMTLTREVAGLKEELKLVKNLAYKEENDNRKNQEKKKKIEEKKTKNKK